MLSTVQPSLDSCDYVNPADTPHDSVSCISWAPKAGLYSFACSAWDSTIRIYDNQDRDASREYNVVQKAKFTVEDPCLSVTWSGDMLKLFAGCINNSIKSVDISTGKSVNVGTHGAAVKDIYWIQAANTLCTLSYDKTMRFWDLRQQNHVAKFDLGRKVFCSDMSFPNILMGTSDEKILIVNLPSIQRTFSQGALQYIDSPLGVGAQLTSVGFFADGKGIAMGSHDGRANISRLESTNPLRLSHEVTFKSHLSGDRNNDYRITYPTHGIGFSPRARQFVYTVGGDGTIIFWDYDAREKVRVYDFKPNPIVRAKMSPDGAMFAYAIGYDWGKGIEGDMSIKSSIQVRLVQDDDLKYADR